MDPEKTIAVFRKFSNGEIIVLFPEIAATADGYYCSSYVHVGQHGSADYYHVVSHTKPATPQEYTNLKRELEGLGYSLEIRQKIQFDIHSKRINSVRTQ